MLKKSPSAKAEASGLATLNIDVSYDEPDHRVHHPNGVEVSEL